MSILEHHFPPLIAEKYGVNAAIFLRDIYHWCSTNRNNDENFHDGRWWTYQTIKGLCLRHTYWTKNQMEHIIKSCKDQGALLAGHFNDDQFNRTCWYTLSDEAWALFEGPSSISDISEIEDQEIPKSISDISEIDSQEIPESSRKNQKCNKDKYKTVNKAVKEKKDKKEKKDPSAPSWKPERFEAFWTYYRTHGRGEDRQGAAKAWDKLKPDDSLVDTMARALQEQVRSEDWQRGIGIPYAKTWLNNARWKDPPKPPPDPEPTAPTERRYGWY